MSALPESMTLHQRIRTEIEDRILSGDWRPGHRIPFEHELMTQYGCARMTVNKAIASLVEAGLVVRRRKFGSFVAHQRVQSAVLSIPDIQAEVTSRGQTYGLQLLASRRRKPSRQRETEMTLAGGGDLLALRCLHLADDRPFALEDRLISLEAAPDAETVDFSKIAPGSWLLGHIPWTEAEHRISAVNAEAEVAQILGLPINAACLAVERQTWRGAEHITHVRLLFPGATYDLVAHFAPKASEQR